MALIHEKSVLLIMLFSLSLSLGSYSQNVAGLKFDRITTEKITLEKGLSQNTANCIFQDSQGYMWFGTWDGLNRYDGYDFVIWNNGNGLSHNTIWSIVEDDKGMLWIATEDGLNRLDLSSNKISVYNDNISEKGCLGNDFINCLIFDSRKTLWVGTAEGLYLFHEESGSFILIDLRSSVTDSCFITNLYEDRSGDVWAATRDGLFQVSPTSFDVQSFFHSPGDANSISSNDVLSVLQDKSGKFWIGTQYGLNIYEPTENRISRWFSSEQGLSSNVIKVLYEDKEENIWIGTDDELNILEKSSGKFIRYQSLSSTTSLANNDIRSIYQDRSGTIWIGTYKGINKVDFNPSKFTHYYHLADEPNSLADNIVYAFTEDSEGIAWIGTFKGVNILDRKKGTFSFLKHDPANVNSLSSNKIKSLLIDSFGNTWIGTEDAGLNKYAAKNGQISRYPVSSTDAFAISNTNIQCLLEDDQRRLWIGSNLGIDLLDLETGEIKKIRVNENDNSGLSNNKVWTFKQDKNGQIWVGTDGGIDIFNNDLKKLRSYRHDASDPESISGDRIFGICEDSEGLFWIGTIGAGLNRLDPSSGKFKNYQDKHGLPNNVVYGVLEDDQGYLWISTNMGLSKFDKATESFINYGTSDGVQGNEFNSNAYFKNKKGEMYFGGMNGFNVFHPDEITINQNKPKIVITGFEIYNEPAEMMINNQDTILLKFSDNYFAFTFSALDYTNPSKNHYRYRLEGYDDEWITTSSGNRRAEYKKVFPGTYRFRVIGSNNDGVWNDEGIMVRLIIKPAWWKTKAFITLLVVVIFSIVSVIIYSRFINLKKKHNIEKKVLEYERKVFELEQMALRLQMNPHFIFNSLNAIQSFVVSNDTDKAISYLAKFSHLMRMILANSSESYIPLKDEIKALSYYMDLEKLRFDDRFDYTLILDPRIDQEFIEIPPMIIQPYVENAIIHGLINNQKKGKLDISFKLEDKKLLCVIQDDGIGREKAREIREQSGIKRKSRGMMITKERLDLMNKQSKDTYGAKIVDLKDKQGNPAGTRVEVSILYHET